MLYGEELRNLINAPLQMIDRLEYTENGASGLRRISMNEAVFMGHFPGMPVLPGVLQVAAMSQAAKACWYKAHPAVEPCVSELSRIKFRTPVTPGMTLRIECTIVEDDAFRMAFQVKNYVGDDLASSGNLVLVPRPADWFEPLDNSGAVLPEGELVSAVEIQKHIPHRYPFMLVDGSYGMGAVNEETGLIEVRGFRNVCSNDILVSNCYPGYFQVESGAQLGCLSLLSIPENQGKIGFFMSIDEARFFHAVTPGDRLDMCISIENRGRFGIANGIFTVGTTKVTEAVIKFAIVDKQ